MQIPFRSADAPFRASVLLVGAEVSGVNVGLCLEAGLARDVKAFASTIGHPLFHAGEQDSEGAADDGHGFFLAGAELILARADNSDRSRQSGRLEGDGFCLAVEIFIYFQHVLGSWNKFGGLLYGNFVHFQ
eukprot:gnl/TRDRNA2_/TRDRNA2_69610_c0_seq1.p1 gnl/TRDRNA2_/TRDRNA2_69610_c0~~gnl/TRDRNA2_/TRDRNA2_69610_c0_seq1.p1  ORF type:complete len:131 (-),score=6.09 gnl/TRDRNA2_/TRDRNA2_69610_c0_seq1:141-533(-)